MWFYANSVIKITYFCLHSVSIFVNVVRKTDENNQPIAATEAGLKVHQDNLLLRPDPR